MNWIQSHFFLPSSSTHLRAFKARGSFACSAAAGTPPCRDCLLPGETGNDGLQNPFDKSEFYYKLILFHLKVGQHVYTAWHDVFWNVQLFWRPKDTQHKTTVLPNEDAVGNRSSSSNSHWRKSQHHLLLFWFSGSQENRTGCCYKINASCFESTANILALLLFVFVKRAHLCPGFNLAAGDHYPVPASYSVDIISRPFWTSMHCGGCMLCAMLYPSDSENSRPHKQCASVARNLH